ncbi:spore cortex biosynthesis protein YabQ [Cohnella sp. AR92]|uniref:spore cortex biosynthesis protein YabQ n=1 Tax=Cohnella sp. AR92 TaxID=648716 RepID=UPI000F8F436F|nr:spore cortex biosynthesis protein YabQ [Cohnella sp. AR92]RUS48319.1 spore cortex biosynthesis protein YabQ [Cohnella sp. AR92]
MNAAVHWNTIGAMLLCGLAMGVFFDAYRVACHRFSVSRWMIPGFDVVYWFLATLFVFHELLQRNHGEVRLYVFLGLGIGVTGYFGLFSSTVIKAIRLLFRVGQNVLQAIWRTVRILLIVPFLWIVRLLARILETLFIVIAALLLWIFRLAGKLLGKPFAKLGGRAWNPIRKKLEPVVRLARRAGDKWRQIREVFKRKP